MTGNLDFSKIKEILLSLEETRIFYNLYKEPEDGLGEIRLNNLEKYLQQMLEMKPKFILLAEAPGYRGCRYTGIPVTSERIMIPGIEKWGLFGEGYTPTSDNPKGMSEMTATILWQVLEEIADIPPLVWNTAPLHPHKENNPESNKTPNMEELRTGIPLIKELLETYTPDGVLAMGRKAQMICEEMGLSFIPIRHPSHGGKTEFTLGLTEVYQK